MEFQVCNQKTTPLLAAKKTIGPEIDNWATKSSSFVDCETNDHIMTTSSNIVNQIPVNAGCGFKMEKPKMPKFSGDVREYAIFRTDLNMPLHQNTVKERQ